MDQLRAVYPGRGYVIGTFGFIAVLAWLTMEDGVLDAFLIIHVMLFAFIYPFASHPVLVRDWRENLQFVVLLAGLVGILGFLTNGRMATLMPLFTTVLIYAVFALGLNLQFGYTGIINFGHVAFMGIGAYTTAILSMRWIEHAPVLERAGASALAIAAAAVVSGAILGVLSSLLVERSGRGTSGSPGHRSRNVLVAGATGLFLGVLLVVVLLPYPLTSLWSEAFFITGAALCGMALAAAAGVLLGLPTLRLRADYLAIVTIGAAEIFRRFLRNEAWLTRGHAGIPQIPRPLQGAGREWGWLQEMAAVLDVGPTLLLRFIIAAVSLLLVLGAFTILLRSPYGRTLRAIREDEEVPRALGKNVFRFKLQVFALGGAAAALAGALLAWDGRYVSPNHFVPLITFWAWIIIVIGGVGSNKGTVLGALILWTFFFGTQFLDLDTKLGLSTAQGGAFRIVVIGVLLILLMLFKPEGLLGRREEMALAR